MIKHWTGKTPINKSVLGPKFSFIPLRVINPIWNHHFIPFENDSSKCRQEEEIK
jgi:predicted lipoprotein